MNNTPRVPTTEQYVADHPIFEEKDDRFQRYNFSKRIADTIISRKNKDSIVFGLYGAWGEGKSSVLNFIDHELSKVSSIIRIKLNPWRYSDEDSLLKDFFSKICDALGEQLNTRTEKAGEFIKKYGTIGKFLGYDPSAIGQALSGTDIEKLKNRVDELLEKTENKIVIFVDDIDRLDKQEIYSLFRLIKLTADFSNTIYVLSFDEQMVAAAIGERFGAGDIRSGASFLEKIIQVPLTIPKAQTAALKKLCLDLVDNATDNAGISFYTDEIDRFVYHFSSNILIRLTTPRLAVRYGNTLSFSLPLLNGEVNMIDLMLIEALKIFYPEYYNLIKSNPQLFLSPFRKNGRETGDRKELDQHLDQFQMKLSKGDRDRINELLTDLFPTLRSYFGNIEFDDDDFAEWHKDKRIVSTYYFERYFSYTVIADEVSDVLLESVLADLENKDFQMVADAMLLMLKNSNQEEFIVKLRLRETDFTWKESMLLAEVVYKLQDFLVDPDSVLGFDPQSIKGQNALFIYQLFKYHNDEDIFFFVKTLFSLEGSVRLLYMLYYWFDKNAADEVLFNEIQMYELRQILKERAIKEAGAESVFITFESILKLIIYNWPIDDTQKLEEELERYLALDHQNIYVFLRSFVTKTVRPNGFYTEYDFLEVDFVDLASKINMRLLFKYIEKSPNYYEIKDNEPDWQVRAKEYTYEKLVLQFLHWYRASLVDQMA